MMTLQDFNETAVEISQDLYLYIDDDGFVRIGSKDAEIEIMLLDEEVLLLADGLKNIYNMGGTND